MHSEFRIYFISIFQKKILKLTGEAIPINENTPEEIETLKKSKDISAIEKREDNSHRKISNREIRGILLHRFSHTTEDSCSKDQNPENFKDVLKLLVNDRYN